MTGSPFALTSRRKPNFRLPEGAVDTHCHVFGPGARFPYAPAYSKAADRPKETLAALHAHLGISRAVLVQAAYHGTDNRAMLDAIADDPSNRRGVAIVADDISDEELRRLHDGGIRALRYNLVKRFEGLMPMPNGDFLVAMAERIKPFGWHMVLHLEAADIPSLRRMLDRLPVRFAIDHMARVETARGTSQPAFRNLLDLSSDPRCWIKVSCADRIAKPPYAEAIPFARALIEANPGRVLWGTDFPHPNVDHPVDEADLVDLLPFFAPDKSHRSRLLVDNPATLFGL